MVTLIEVTMQKYFNVVALFTYKTHFVVKKTSLESYLVFSQCYRHNRNEILSTSFSQYHDHKNLKGGPVYGLASGITFTNETL